jgi:riboflavin kinase/FMN adenylyltransferase
MEIFQGLETYKACGETTVTIGNFDGIHLGHQQILQRLLEQARLSATHSMVVTFFPHPLTVLFPSKAPGLIIRHDEKIRRISETGIDRMLILHFNQQLALVSGEDFIRRILVETLKVKHILVGKNFHFGHKRTGNVPLMEQLGRETGFQVHVLPPVVIRRERVSSTWIRQLIQTGRVSMANRLLDRFYALQGEIVSGQGVGSQLLFPTLNLKTENDIWPLTGVYITLARIEGRQYPAVTNVGRRPTLNGRKVTIETHLLNYTGKIHPSSIELAFLHRLRPEIKFSSLEELKIQISRDCQRALRFFRLINKLQISQGHITLPTPW